MYRIIPRGWFLCAMAWVVFCFVAPEAAWHAYRPVDPQQAARIWGEPLGAFALAGALAIHRFTRRANQRRWWGLALVWALAVTATLLVVGNGGIDHSEVEIDHWRILNKRSDGQRGWVDTESLVVGNDGRPGPPIRNAFSMALSTYDLISVERDRVRVRLGSGAFGVAWIRGFVIEARPQP